MLIQCDAAQLEWRTILQLSQDEVGIQEQRLDVEEANKALNDAGIHNEMRKMLSGLDLKKLSFE